MLISEVIAAVKAYCLGTNSDGSPISDEKTRDQVLWGAERLGQECTGIVTCIWASSDVIRQAHERGANLIVSHEALFWNHGDHTDWLRAQKNAAFLAKTALLDEYGITVWRCHDYIHSGVPLGEGGSYVDGIFLGLADRLGWSPEGPIAPLANQPIFLTTQLNGLPARELAAQVAEALGSNGVRIIGDPDTRVHRVGVAMHMIGFLDNAMITAMDEGIDCLLAMETTDYTLLQYVQDASENGVPKCILSCGHFNIEDPGMAYMVNWLPEALGDSAPAVSYIKAGDPFQYVIIG